MKLLFVICFLALLLNGCEKKSEPRTYRTALVEAIVFENASSAAEQLIQKGVDVNVMEDNGRTALMYAAGVHLSNSDRQMIREGKSPSLENLSLVKLLLERGANPNAVSIGGDTALMSAIYHGRPDTVRLLLQYGADPNLAAGPSKTTPLILASHYCFEDIVDILVKNNANHAAKDAGGGTAETAAQKSQCSESLLSKLRNSGAG